MFVMLHFPSCCFGSYVIYKANRLLGAEFVSEDDYIYIAVIANVVMN